MDIIVWPCCNLAQKFLVGAVTVAALRKAYAELYGCCHVSLALAIVAVFDSSRISEIVQLINDIGLPTNLPERAPAHHPLPRSVATSVCELILQNLGSFGRTYGPQCAGIHVYAKQCC